MPKTLQYVFIFVFMVVLVLTSMGDAFDQTVHQIKMLGTELEQTQTAIAEKQTFIEAELTTEFADHALKAPQGEFESDADYQARQRRLTGIIATRRTELEAAHLSVLRVRRLEIQTDLGRLRQKVFFTHDFTASLGAYDANTESFPIEFEIHDQRILVGLRVEKNDAPGLKKNWDQVIKTAYVSIDPGNRRALAWVKLEYPLLWEEGITWRFDRVYFLGNNTSVAFSPDGKYLATGSRNESGIATERGIATIWRVADGEKFRRLDHGDWVYAVAFSPDGKYLATGGKDELGRWSDGKVVLWDMKRGAKVESLPHDYTVEAVVFSPNGKYLATACLRRSSSGIMFLWDVDSGSILWGPNQYRLYTATARTINALTFTRDGSYLATGNQSYLLQNRRMDTATFWQVKSGNAIQHFGHHNEVYDVAFSPDGAYLATGNDGSVTLWEMRSGQRVRHIEIPDKRAAGVAFSPDGKYLAVLAVQEIKETNYSYIDFFRIGRDAITFETVIPKVKSIYVGTESRDIVWHPHGNLISDGRSVYRTLLEPMVTDLSAAPLATRRDVNRDGVVDVEDLVLVASNFGKTFTADANPNPDVNGDGVVDRKDVLQILAALEAAAGAPSQRLQRTAETLQRWIRDAEQFHDKDQAFREGLRVLKRLLATLGAAETIPKQTALLPNYPNPFNPETWMPYQLAAPGDVTVTISAMDGRVVRTLSLGHQAAGIYERRSRAAYWDGRNELGETVASGVYFYTLTAGEFTATRKLLIRK